MCHAQKRHRVAAPALPGVHPWLGRAAASWRSYFLWPASPSEEARILAELARLNYDTANVTSGPAMAALLKLVPASQALYGTDYPYFGVDQYKDLAQSGLSAADVQAIEHGNAERLMPSLKST